MSNRLLLMLLLFAPQVLSAAEPSFDVVLRGGRVVDGTGAPWYLADIGVRDGRIAEIGRIPAGSGRRELDCSGRTIVPGFIDMMGQTATPLLDDPRSALNLLTQGITTINAGEGDSAAPLDETEGAGRGWRTMGEHFQLLDLKGLPVNVVQTVGHTQVRRLVLGEIDRRPDDGELERMRALVREAMEAGAIGVSTALIYPPAVFARTEEIAALAAVAGEHGGGYYTHMRNEGDLLLEAIDEALAIGREARSPVHIFHLKAAGRQNWPKTSQAIARIKAARGAGQQVTADIYPYVHNGLGIEAFIHPRHFAEGRPQLVAKLGQAELRAEIRREMEEVEGWENWYRHVGRDWGRVVIGSAVDPRYAPLVGRSLAEIAKERGEDPWEVFFNLVRTGAFALPESMSEADKLELLRQEFVSFCTDVGPAGEGASIASHPRGWGAFPRLFARYVRELGGVSLERAVAQATAAAANDVRIFDRGRIAVGLAADLVVLDYENFVDRATFAAPSTPATGVQHVLVNGELVLEEGRQTSQRPGRVLRGPGWRSERAPWSVRTGEENPQFASFDRLLQRFLEEHRAPGAALAVTDGGKLVYSQGYGYADVAAGEPARADSLFRIASLSKPITAVAVLQLVEQGKLRLEDKVFSLLDYEAHLEPDAKPDARLADITIEQLLEHRGGWDRDQSFDAMFQSVRFAQLLGTPAPAGPDEVIRCMLGLPLDFAPGERYAYSNYGYCLLGRLVERASGMGYEEYVRERVLAPIGVTSMRIGASRLEGRQPGEVRYYDPSRSKSVFAKDLGELVPTPYGGWHLEAMDAHGGWIASAVDLAKFCAAFDDPEHSPLLKAESIRRMYGRPAGLAGHDDQGQPKEVYYSLGWQNRVVGEHGANHWHTGSLGGTATLMVRRHDGRNWVVLFNARSSAKAGHLGNAIDPLLHKAANESFGE